jgi:hypothetical protein
MNYHDITMGDLDAMTAEVQREYHRWLWHRWSGNTSRSTDVEYQMDHRDALAADELEIGEQP